MGRLTYSVLLHFSPSYPNGASALSDEACSRSHCNFPAVANFESFIYYFPSLLEMQTESSMVLDGPTAICVCEIKGWINYVFMQSC